MMVWWCGFEGWVVNGGSGLRCCIVQHRKMVSAESERGRETVEKVKESHCLVNVCVRVYLGQIQTITL